MKEFFDALMGLDHVNGALIIDETGQTVYDPFELNKMAPNGPNQEWKDLIQSDAFSKEMDLVFDTGRIFIRKILSDYLLIFMDPNGSASSLKLTCDLYEPQLVKTKSEKKFFKLFF